MAIQLKILQSTEMWIDFARKSQTFKIMDQNGTVRAQYVASTIRDREIDLTQVDQMLSRNGWSLAYVETNERDLPPNAPLTTTLHIWTGERAYTQRANLVPSIKDNIDPRSGQKSQAAVPNAAAFSESPWITLKDGEDNLPGIHRSKMPTGIFASANNQDAILKAFTSLGYMPAAPAVTAVTAVTAQAPVKAAPVVTARPVVAKKAVMSKEQLTSLKKVTAALNAAQASTTPLDTYFGAVTWAESEAAVKGAAGTILLHGLSNDYYARYKTKYENAFAQYGEKYSLKDYVEGKTLSGLVHTAKHFLPEHLKVHAKDVALGVMLMKDPEWMAKAKAEAKTNNRPARDFSYSGADFQKLLMQAAQSENRGY